MTDTLSVTPVRSVAGVRGERVACGPEGRWAAAERRFVVLDGAAVLTAPRALDGALRFSASGDALLAGTERLELPAAVWAGLADPRPAVAGGAKDLDLTAAAWDADGEALAVAGERRPVRPAGAGASSVPGPMAWLTLLDGRTRTPCRSLWHGVADAPRHVAVEAGAIAADADAGACVWAGGKEFRLDVGPVIGLALGDAGRLLALVDLDGAVGVWRGPRYARRVRVGAGAQGAIAAAAAAPVVAWARADGAAVWAGGETAVLRTPAIRALALNPDGTRLVALDVASTLHEAAITISGRVSGAR
ncbi:MAG TPA: hypothetical protein VK631_16540 [Solirubrobacteraceae bacterium]|nr:hypothetical protein [Solirubrobacteraceae bacterium]